MLVFQLTPLHPPLTRAKSNSAPFTSISSSSFKLLKPFLNRKHDWPWYVISPIVAWVSICLERWLTWEIGKGGKGLGKGGAKRHRKILRDNIQ
jgi:hypothetical protein